MTASEKVAYLRGLVEGYGIDTSTKDGKLLSVVMDVLEELANEIAELEEGLDAVSDDLGDVEDALMDLELDDEEDEDDEDDEVLDPTGKVYYDVCCPACGDIITFDEDQLEEGGIVCPSCGENLEFDLGGENAPEA